MVECARILLGARSLVLAQPDLIYLEQQAEIENNLSPKHAQAIGTWTKFYDKIDVESLKSFITNQSFGQGQAEQLKRFIQDLQNTWVRGRCDPRISEEK
jgi:hypothetical protein